MQHFFLQLNSTFIMNFLDKLNLRLIFVVYIIRQEVVKFPY